MQAYSQSVVKPPDVWEVHFDQNKHFPCSGAFFKESKDYFSPRSSAFALRSEVQGGLGDSYQLKNEKCLSAAATTMHRHVEKL